MKPGVAIMAHAGAQPTVDLFLPQWKTLDCSIYCSAPEGEHVAGFQRYVSCGVSAYSGIEVFRRFTLTLDAMILNQHDPIIIAEYDTVNLRPDLPRVIPGCVTAYFSMDGDYLCALSPWSMDRKTAFLLWEACREALHRDGDYLAGKGLLDRWIGNVVKTAGIPYRLAPDVLSYPWHAGAHDRIKRMGFNWIHGWKTKEEFGGLIP